MSESPGLPANLAEFGKPTRENVVTWGASANLNFDPTVVDVFPPPTDQLVYVERRRPTTYNVLTVLRLGPGWTGEIATLALQIEYTVGIGTMKTTFTRTIPFAALSNTIPIVDVFRTPAAVLSVRAAIGSTAGAAPAVAAPHVASVSCGVAPEYA